MAKKKCPGCGKQKVLKFPYPNVTHCSAECFLIAVADTAKTTDKLNGKQKQQGEKMIDETRGQDLFEHYKPVGVRTRVMDSLTLNCMFLGTSPGKRVSNLGTLLRLVLNGTLSAGKKKVMNITELVDKWVEAVAGMCLAHDKDEYDRHDARADELLGPLLAAPVKQIREFYDALRVKLQADKRVPFLVWIAFEAWGEAVVKNAPDEGIKRLKHKLAADIAELVEGPAAEQLPKAIQRALCWRDEETLKEIKTALEGGAKPRMVGRQSCLFLETRHKGKKISVML